jgi:hypothetical protein
MFNFLSSAQKNSFKIGSCIKNMNQSLSSTSVVLKFDTLKGICDILTIFWTKSAILESNNYLNSNDKYLKLKFPIKSLLVILTVVNINS